MAEVLGIVASGIAVGQLTAEIIKGISKLRSLVRYARDAPQTVHSTIEEMEIMSHLLQELQVNVPSDGLPSSSAAMIHKCIDRCHHTAIEINSIVSRLEEGMNRKKVRRQWTSLQAILKKEELEDLHKRLDHAKAMLSLAIDCFQMVRNQKQQKSLDQLLEAISIEEKTSVKTLKIRQKPTKHPANLSPSRISTYRYWWGLGTYIQTIQSQIYADEHDYDRQDETHVSYFVPSYFFRRLAFHFTASSTGGAWKYSLSPIRILPNDSPIFKACVHGDIMEIARLISCGQATIHDSTTIGSSLLHVAAIFKHDKLVVWLLENGANANCVDIFGETPLYRAINHSLWDVEEDHWDQCLPVYQKGPQIESVRALIEQGQSDPMAESKYGTTSLHSISASEESIIQSLHYIIKQQQMFDIDLETDELGWDIFKSLWLSNSPDYRSYFDSMDILVGRDLIISKYFDRHFYQYYFGDHGTLLTFSATQLSDWSDWYDGLEWPKDHDFWISDLLYFAAELIRSGAQLHVVSTSGFTCLDVLLSTQYLRGERNCRSLFLRWLQCLHQEGIDITNYFRIEQSLHNNGKLLPARGFYRVGVERNFDVTYGQNQDEVTIHIWDSVVDRAKESQIPGSWDTEAEWAEENDLIPYENQNDLVDWTISTTGFSSRDYSPETAGIIGQKFIGDALQEHSTVEWRTTGKTSESDSFLYVVPPLIIRCWVC